MRLSIQVETKAGQMSKPTSDQGKQQSHETRTNAKDNTQENLMRLQDQITQYKMSHRKVE